MPNLVDIVEMAEALESKAVFVAPERCVAVRNRHSSCKKCSEACPVGAVSVGNNVVSIDAGACMACGACTVSYTHLDVYKRQRLRRSCRWR